MEEKYPNGILFIKIILCFSYDYFSGGGYYNEKGEKIKKWIDLHFNFSKLLLSLY